MSDVTMAGRPAMATTPRPVLLSATLLGLAGPLLGLLRGGSGPWTAALTAVALLGMASVAVVTGDAGRHAAPAIVAAGALAGLALLTAASIGWSAAPEAGLRSALRVFLYLAAFAAAAVVVRTRAAVWAALAGVAIASVTLALTAVVQVLAASDPTTYFFMGRLQGPVGYQNGFAAAVLAGTPGLLVLAARPGARVVRIVAFAGLGLLVPVALAAQSRGVLLGAAAAAAAIGALHPSRARLVPPLLGVAAAVAVSFGATVDLRDGMVAGPVAGAAATDAWVGRLVLAAAVAGALGGLWALLEPRLAGSPRAVRAARAGAGIAAAAAAVAALIVVVLHSSQLADQPLAARANTVAPATGDRIFSADASGRTELWHSAVSGIADRPLLGQGAGGFYPWWDSHRLTASQGFAASYAHDLALDIGVETGAVGLALFAAWLGGVAAALVAVLRRTRRSVPAALGLLGIVVLWLVSGVFDWFWHLPAATVAAMVAAGALAGIAPRRRSGSLHPSKGATEPGAHPAVGSGLAKG